MCPTSVRLLCCLALMSAPLLPLPCLAQDKSSETREIKDLNKEQGDLLDAALKELAAQWDAGASREVAVAATEQVLAAKMRLAETPQQRIAVLEKQLQNATRNADLLDAGANVGIARRYQVLQAQARVREVRVQLLTEQQKVGAKKQ
jgi:hypothetical protein